MTCTEARDAMLVADLAELLPEGDSPLAVHLRSCAECRAAARAITSGTAAVGIAAMRRGAASPRLARRVAGWSSVAAAATIVFAVASQNRETRRGDDRSMQAKSLPVARHVSLEVARGQQATMLKTSDPKITVIWLSSGEGK